MSKMKNMKNIFLLIVLIAGVGVMSCSNDPKPKAKPKAKKETTVKKTKTDKPTYTMAKFWSSSKRKFKLTDVQIKRLKTLKSDFDKKKKGKSKDAVDKLRNTYYANIKSAIGKEKGQQYINYSRRYKRKMAAERK